LISFCMLRVIRLEIQGDRGYLQTPNYPASYPLNFTNFWTIRGPRGSLLQLNFTSFDVEANKKCLYDHVLIGNTKNQWTKRYCGNDIPPGYTSINNNIYIKFVSDRTDVRRGFKARWRAINTIQDPTSTAVPTQNATPVNCRTRYIVTITDPPCPKPSKESYTATSCHCPPTTPSHKRSAPSSNAMTTLPSLLSNPDPLTANAIQEVDIDNNTVTEKCPQERDKQIDDSEASSNRRLVIVLASFTVLFFFVDVLLLALLCRRYKRRRNDMVRNCRTELPPVELKIVDGKVISSPRKAGHRVKFSDLANRKSASHESKGCRLKHKDDNRNVKGDQGIDLLKDSRYADHNECSTVVLTDYTE